MQFCPSCGAKCSEQSFDGILVPCCAEHGPVWVLVRTGAAVDVLIEHDDRLLLVRRATEPFAGWWATVGGFINPREHPREAAIREAREELGVEVALSGLLGVYSMDYRIGESIVVIAYVATTESAPSPNPAEVAEWNWFTPDELPVEMAWNHRERVEDWAKSATRSE